MFGSGFEKVIGEFLCRWHGVKSSSLVVAESSGEDAGGFGVFLPFGHAFGVGKGGEPFEEADEAFAALPVGLGKGVAEVLAGGLGGVVGGGGFADGEEEVAQRRRGEGRSGGGDGAAAATRVSMPLVK